MNDSGGFAPISSKLIKDLNKAFPPRDDFSPKTDQCTLMFFYGQRSVIRFLESQHKQQNENILTKE